MNTFSIDFFVNCMFGITILSIIVITPGISIQYMLGNVSKLRYSSALFFAPALGMSIYGPVSLLFSSVFGYSFYNLLLIILGFNGFIFIVYKKYSFLSADYAKQIPFHYIFLLLFCAAFFAVLPTIQIYPFISKQALFINEMIFDHAKCAIIDTIAREGLQPLNPYFSSYGEALPLNYYYQWYFVASQLKILGGLSGWQADIVMTWFTAFAAVSLLVGITLQITKPRAGFFVIILFFTGSIYTVLCWIFGTRFRNIFCISPLRDLEAPWLQLSWAPQHVFSALSIILALFLCSKILNNSSTVKNSTISRKNPMRTKVLADRIQSTQILLYSAVIGICIASAAASSIWVGGVALALAAPIIGAGLISAKTPKKDIVRLVKTCLIALPWCVLFFWPVLSSMIKGAASAQDSPFPVALDRFASTNLVMCGSWIANSTHVMMFWIRLLPLSLGIIFIAGVPALLLRVAPNKLEQYLKRLTLAASIGFLLVSQFFKSVILNNDLGWRAVIVPEMILIVWAAVMMSDFIYSKNPAKSEWYFGSILFRWRYLISSITTACLTIGILSFICCYHFSIPPHTLDQHTLKVRQRFLLQKEAWGIVRNYVKPDEIVQSNPDGYKEITPWPANIPFALFADRRIAFASPEFVYAYSHNINEDLRNSQYHLIQNIFSKNPTKESILKIRDELNIKGLFIDQFDAVWNSTLLEDSGIYTKVYSDKNFKIYIANEPKNKGLKI